MRGKQALTGRQGLWLWNWSSTGERTLPRILDTMRDFGNFDLLVPKVADGMLYQGVLDQPTQIRSINDILVMRDECEARGITLCPVVVPRGRAVQSEALFHAEIARAVGCLMTDIEPYEGFWDGSPYSQIPVYTRLLRQHAPDAYLVNQPDPRSFGRRDSRVDETADDFDAICAQHYVGWASVGWTDIAREVQSFLSLTYLGRDMYATLYGIERTDLAGEFWRQIVDRALGAHVFRIGAMDAEQLRFFGGLPRPFIAPPEPPPDPEPPVNVDLLRALIDTRGEMIQRDRDDVLGAQIRLEEDERRLAEITENLGG